MIEVDFRTPGDRDITRDTRTGLEFLDLGLTENRSLFDIPADLAPGRPFTGFRIATFPEVNSLLVSAGLPALGDGGGTGVFFVEEAPLRALIELLDRTAGDDARPFSAGIVPVPGDIQRIRFSITDVGETLIGLVPTLLGSDDDHGIFLVRDFEIEPPPPPPPGGGTVPLPSTLALAGLGLAALRYRRRN